MKTTEINSDIIDHYYALLKSLSRNDKLELISRLSASMKSDKKQQKDDSWKSLYGSLELDESADEFVERLENDRNFNREPIDL